MNKRAKILLADDLVFHCWGCLKSTTTVSFCHPMFVEKIVCRIRFFISLKLHSILEESPLGNDNLIVKFTLETAFYI